MSNYKFNPTDHGFEHIENFPELGFYFPMVDGYYVKVVAYGDYGGLV